MILGTENSRLIENLSLLLRNPFMIGDQMRRLANTNQCLVPASPASSRPELPLLKRGSRGKAVKELQTILNQLGASPRLPQTENFGDMTWTAVTQFQTTNGLKPVDGVVGPKTWGAFERLLGRRITIANDSQPAAKADAAKQSTAEEFVKNAIRPALNHLGLYSEAAEQLLLGTAIHESLLKSRRQIGGGPARGLFQMEPATHDDIWDNFLKYKPDLSKKLTKLLSSEKADKIAELETNDIYAAGIARIGYYRVSEAIPKLDDIEAMARYWKKYWNTELGKGTVEQYIEHWNQFMGGSQNHPPAAARNYQMFGQAQKEWAKDIMAGTTTLQNSGCVVSSIAMALRTAGISVDGEDCTPGALNKFIADNKGYASGSLLIWSTINKLPRVTWQGKHKVNHGTIRKLLADGSNALIMNVKNGEHWVLVESPATDSSGTYVCCDPGNGSGVRKAYSLKEVKDLSVYRIS
jgi:hypothetical protein